MARKKRIKGVKPPPQRPLTGLKNWRKLRGLTQEKLADLSGLSASAISQLERGVQGYSREGLGSLAKALRCTVGDLTGEDSLAFPSIQREIMTIWEQANEDERRAIVAHAKVIVQK